MWRAFLIVVQLRIEISRYEIREITLIHTPVFMETASDLHLHREQLSPSTVMHIASTASYTGKRGYPPTYTQACAQGRK